jgi:hypothetical protein
VLLAQPLHQPFARRVRDVLERLAAPEPACPAQGLDGQIQLARNELPTTTIGQFLEHVQVELARLDDQPVAGPVQHEPALSSRGWQHSAQFAHVGLQVARGRTWRTVPPQRPDQCVR